MTSSTRTVQNLPGSAAPGKIAVLFLRVLPRSGRIGARRCPRRAPPDAADQLAVARVGVRLDALDEPLEALVLDVLRHLSSIRPASVPRRGE